MKKILLGSIVLTIFSLSIILFQFSCQKEATAQTTPYTLPTATTSTLGGIIVGTGLSVTNNGVLSVTNSTGGLQQLNKIVYQKYYTSGATEIWTANYDGTGQTKLNITLSTGLTIDEDGSVKLSPDGQTVFFDVIEIAAPVYRGIYSCKIDGTNVRQIVAPGTAESAGIGGAY